MRPYDLMIVGPATRDRNTDYTGREELIVGGAVTYCTPAARAAGAKVFSAVKASPADEDIVAMFRRYGEDAALLPSPVTTLMSNVYFTADRERRHCGCQAQSDPVTLDQVPEVSCRLYHLAGLLYGDFPNSLIEGLHGRGMVSADAQGFLRPNEGGELRFHDWADKMRYLPYMDFFKTDAAEAEILTGLTDRAAAAKQLYAWGAKEVMVSHNTEILVFDGHGTYTCPIKARNLSGRTGRGDTTFGSYLAMRMTGADVPTALQYATACVSLKMETPGPFQGTRADVEAYIREFYQ